MNKTNLLTISFKSVCLLSLFFSSAHVTAQTWYQESSFVPNTVEGSENFGFSVAHADSFILVGSAGDNADSSGKAPCNACGSAFIYKIDSNNVPRFHQKLITKDRSVGDGVGTSVSFSEKIVIVSATHQDKNASGSDSLKDAGAVYVFRANSRGEWFESQKLVAHDRAKGDWFGGSTHIFDSTIVIAAYHHDLDKNGWNSKRSAGAVYVFEPSDSTEWKEHQKITPDDRDSEDFFGTSIAMDHEHLVVGAAYEDHDTFGSNRMPDAGSVYIFKRNKIGKWSQFQKLVANDRRASARFGTSVSIKGEYLIIGASNDDKGLSSNTSISGSGSAYIFRKDSSGRWNQLKKLAARDRTVNGKFGRAVFMLDSLAFVGVHADSTGKFGKSYIPGAGSAYAYKLRKNGTWQFTDKLVAKDRSSAGWFGYAISADLNKLVISAMAAEVNSRLAVGKVYVFKQCAPDSKTITLSRCSPMTSPSGKYQWYKSGVYHDTVLVNDECNRYYTVHLKVNIPSFDTITVIECDSFISPSGKQTWYSSGRYGDIIPNSNGCDSLITIDLTIIKPSVTSLAIEVCDSFMAPSGNKIYKSSGRYKDTMKSTLGCDSIISIDLKVNHPSRGNIFTGTACNEYQLDFDWLITESGIYLDTLTNSLGCDSIIEYHLTIIHDQYDSFNIESCEEIKSPSGKYIWDKPGVYLDTIASYRGCDSIMQFTIGPYKPDITVQRKGDTLAAQEVDAEFQWLNCDNGYRRIVGSKSVEFVPEVSGDYAVEITKNACIDTSACFLVQIMSLDRSNENTVSIFPNPTEGLISINVLKNSRPFSFEIYNALGQKVISMEAIISQTTDLALPKEAGVYSIVFRYSNQTTSTARIIKI